MTTVDAQRTKSGDDWDHFLALQSQLFSCILPCHNMELHSDQPQPILDPRSNLKAEPKGINQHPPQTLNDLQAQKL